MTREEIEKLLGYKLPDGMADDQIKKLGEELGKSQTLAESNKKLETENDQLKKDKQKAESDLNHQKDEAKKAFEARDQAKSERREAESELKKLQDSGGYQKLYEEEKSARTTAETRVKELEDSEKTNKRKSTVTRLLEGSEANPKYVDFLISQLGDINQLDIKEDGTITGFDDKVKKLKEDHPAMFGKEFIKGPGYQDGKTPAPPKIKVGDQEVQLKYFTREQVDKMTDSETVENIDSVNWSQQQWLTNSKE